MWYSSQLAAAEGLMCSRVTAAAPDRYLEQHETNAKKFNAVVLQALDALRARAVVLVHVNAAAAAAAGHAAERERRVTEF